MAMTRTRRLGAGLNVLLFFVALVAIAAAVNVLASTDGLRWRIDATKTRAYSLSPQTLELLDDLEGEWTIAVVMVESETDAPVREQVDEVLDRYVRAAPNIDVVRIDPTEPASLVHYEGLLGRLRERYADRVGAYDTALDDGLGLFETMRLFAEQEVTQASAAIAAVGAPLADAVQHWPGRLMQYAEQGSDVVDAIADARRVTDVRPLPDYETARSVLAALLSQAALDFDETARRYDDWTRDGAIDQGIRAYAQAAATNYLALAEQLAQGADELQRLEVLELSEIGRQLAAGEAAIVMNEVDAAVIPSSQLFPTLDLRGSGDRVVAFDRRFRGEQVISAAIRSLLVESMPLVVFMHAGEASMLTPLDNRADVEGVGNVLAASRFEIAEWRIGQGDPPQPRAGQAVAWVVVPSSQSGRFGPEGPELRLIQEVGALIDRGESVLLSIYPSIAPRFGRTDPWVDVAAAVGVTPASDRVVCEVVPGADATVLRGQVVRTFGAEHPICAALNGQPTFLPLPMPLEVDAHTPATPIITVQPAPGRWLEEDWWQGEIDPPVDLAENRLQTDAHVAVTVERTVGARTQRVIVVGSGGWMLSYAADETVSIGGGRAALTNPGNHELMLSAVAWLTNHDELIAPSPVSQQVARLDGVTSRVQLTWFILTVLALPTACLLAGVGVWMVRR